MYSSAYLCQNCSQYGGYISEEWFKELVKIQRRQDYIDSKEKVYSAPDAFVNVFETIPNTQGRPKKIKQDVITVVIDLYNKLKPISYRNLSKALKDVGIELNKDSVSKIIKTYENR